MSTRRGGVAKGAPKHQNSSVWKPDRSVQRKESEVGTKTRPFAQITGVCARCKEQIEWRRKYGKYKLMVEPSKCNQCGKRAVKAAHHTLCTACATARGVCAKCCKAGNILSAETTKEKEDEEKERLREALRGLRERDRRTLLRAMDSGKGEKEKESMLGRAIKKKDGDGDDDDDDEDEDEEDEDEDEDNLIDVGDAKDGEEVRAVIRAAEDEDDEDQDEDDDDEDGDGEDVCRKEVQSEEGSKKEEIERKRS